MTRYAYNIPLRPPAPFVLLALRRPRSGAEIRDVPALLDSAADGALLPLTVAEELNQGKIGDLDIGGVGGSVERMTVYDVLLGIRPLPLRLVEVVAHADEPSVLLGRDVLNGHRLLLDGPGLALEIG
jgi:hypothetical protein